MRSKFTQFVVGTLGALSAVALTAGIAVAGGDLTDEQKQLMSQLDSNQDGVISSAEAQNHPDLAQRFKELDQNRNRVLEQAEFAQFEVSEPPPMQ